MLRHRSNKGVFVLLHLKTRDCTINTMTWAYHIWFDQIANVIYLSVVQTTDMGCEKCDFTYY